MIRKTCLLALPFLLLAADGFGMRRLRFAVELSENDREELHRALDVDPGRILDLDAYGLPADDDSPAEATEADVTILVKRLAPGIDSTHMISCWKRDGEWTCANDSPDPIIFADRPKNCRLSEEPVSSLGVPIYGERDLSVGEVRDVLDYVCMSDEMYERAWHSGHRLGGIRAIEGGFEVRTYWSATGGFGEVFRLEERCSGGRCELRIEKIYSWRT